MKKVLIKWLPTIVIVFIVFISMLVTLIFGSSLPKFKFEDENTIKDSEINKITDLLKSDDTKRDAQSKLDELYFLHI